MRATNDQTPTEVNGEGSKGQISDQQTTTTVTPAGEVKGLTAQSVLSILGARDDEHFALWAKEGFAQPTPLNRINETIAALPTDYNIYFAVNPTGERRRGNKGTAEQTTRLLAATCDLDAKAGGLDTFEKCDAVIADLANILETNPSVIIHTGHGLQPIWPLEGTEELTLAEMQALIRRFGGLAKRVAKGHGGKVDSTFNLDRLHRAPETTNTKPGQVPVKTRAEYTEAHPLSLARLREALDEYVPEDEATDDTGPGSLKHEWTYAEKTCPYVLAMIRGWPTDEPQSSRHAWLGQHAVRLTAAVRLGCINEADFKTAQTVLTLRFLELLARPEARKPEPKHEIAAWFRDAIGIIEKKSDDQTRKELGNHTHTEPTPDVIFEATPELAYIKALARAQMMSPSAVLVSAVTFVLAATRHDAVIPAFIGEPASLNSNAGIVGESGDGKTASVGVAKGMFGNRELVAIRNPSSGEGIPAIFRERRPVAEMKDAPEGTDPMRWICHNAMSVFDEVAAMGAQSDRSGSTLGATIRSAWSGAGLSNHAADPSRQRNLPAGEYRYCMIVGIQPSTANVLLRDEGSGTPQRFLLASATDPGADMNAPDPGPSPFESWRPPYGIGKLEIGYPEHVRPMVRDARRRRLLGDPDAPDGHLLLVRLKVAAGLAILHGKTDVDESMWTISGLLIADSERLFAELKRYGRKESDKIAAARGRSSAISDSAAVDYAVERVKVRLSKKVRATAGGVRRSRIQREIAARDRGHLDDAIEAAISGGYIVEELRPRAGKPNAEPAHWLVAGKASI